MSASSPSNNFVMKSMSRTTVLVPMYRRPSPIVCAQTWNCDLYSASASRCVWMRWYRLKGSCTSGATSYPRSRTVFAMNA